MDLQDSMHNRNLSSFYPENDDFPHSDGIFNTVREEKEVPSVKGRFHAATEGEKIQKDRYIYSKSDIQQSNIYQCAHDVLSILTTRAP